VSEKVACRWNICHSDDCRKYFILN